VGILVRVPYRYSWDVHWRTSSRSLVTAPIYTAQNSDPWIETITWWEAGTFRLRRGDQERRERE
jgi:hypothetical protein